MSRRFAVFDIDGTLIRWQLYHAVVEELIARQKLPKHLIVPIDTARSTWKERANEDSYRVYEHVLWESYMKALTTLAAKDVDAAMQHVFTAYKNQVYTYTRDLIKQLKAKDYLLFAVSGSHHELVELLGNYYGFDGVVGTKYLQRNGVYTGEEVNVVTRKDAVLRELVSQHQADWQGSIGIGDTKSDAAMLALVETAIAFNPNRDLYKIAVQYDWDIVLERKNMIYKLRGHDGSYKLV